MKSSKNLQISNKWMRGTNKGGFNMRKTLSVLILGIALLCLDTSAVFAYNGTAAKNYADNYALSPNSGVYPVFSEDCTNFISQALFAGGYSMVGNYPGNSNVDNSFWYFNHYFNVWTHSWSVAMDQITFQYTHSPGGSFGNMYNGNIGSSEYNDALIGDILAYDFGSGDGYSHLSLEVGTGTDPSSGWVGDLVDAHTSNRYHAYWTLQPYNPEHYSTTHVLTIHISSSNN